MNFNGLYTSFPSFLRIEYFLYPNGFHLQSIYSLIGGDCFVKHKEAGSKAKNSRQISEKSFVVCHCFIRVFFVSIYFLGVVPNFFLKAAIKWLGILYPSLRESSLTLYSSAISHLRASSIL